MYDICVQYSPLANFTGTVQLVAAAGTYSTLVVAAAAVAGSFLNVLIRRCFL
jgi:hypothetical protein